MELSRNSILSKTHYGLNIYAFVIRQYYSNQFLISVTGRKCKPTKNPFNKGKATLLIEIINNCAIHSDLENSIPAGDVFNFAELHFNLSGLKLLEKINEALHLRIGQSTDSKSQVDDICSDITEQKNQKIILPKFSLYKKPIYNIKPFKETDVLEVYKQIKSDNYKYYTDELRKISDAEKARKYKAFNFEYVTFSGIFSERNEKHLKKHSGLLTIDFDHLPNLTSLKTKLLEDEYFETDLLFTSPSGNGLKWVVSIDVTKTKHQDYFKAITNYIEHTYRLKIDQSGKDTSRACFLPHDPNAFMNPKYVQS